LITIEHWHQLTNKGEETVEIFQVGVEFLQAIVVKQLKKLMF